MTSLSRKFWNICIWYLLMIAFGFYFYIICMWYLRQYLVSTDDIMVAWCLGWSINYVTLKLPFLTHLPPTITLCYVCSQEPSYITSCSTPWTLFFFNYAKVLHWNFFTVTSWTSIKYHPLPLIYHHGESWKMCRPTYPQGMT